MPRRSIVIITALLLFAGPAVWAEAEHWLHVQVEKAGSDSENVRINIPLSMVEAFLPLLPEERVSRERIDIGGHRWDKEELRQLWENLKLQPGAGLVSIQTQGSKMTVALEDGNLMVRSLEGSAEQVDIRIPTGAVDALLSGPGSELDLPAAIRALKQNGPNQIVSVRSHNETVRVWIDQKAGAP